MTTTITVSEEEIAQIIKTMRTCESNVSLNCYGSGVNSLFKSKRICIHCHREILKVKAKKYYDKKRVNVKGKSTLQSTPEYLESLSATVSFD